MCNLIFDSEPKFSIGVFGNWGTGKTTLLRNLEKNLSEKGCNCLFFNAWKYEQEPAHISVPLILSILLEIYKDNKTELDSWKKTGINEQSIILWE